MNIMRILGSVDSQAFLPRNVVNFQPWPTPRIFRFPSPRTSYLSFVSAQRQFALSSQQLWLQRWLGADQMLVAFLPVLHKSESPSNQQRTRSVIVLQWSCASPPLKYIFINICAFNYFSQGFVRFVMKIVLVDKMNQHQAGFGFNHATHPKWLGWTSAASIKPQSVYLAFLVNKINCLIYFWPDLPQHCSF